MAVKAKINKLPVLVTDDDVDCFVFDVNLSESPFSYCCGCVEMGHATCRGPDGLLQGVTPAAKEALKGRLRDSIDEYHDCGLAVYTLTDDQVTEREALLEVGFLEAATFRNPNTGRRVTMYGLLMNQPRQSPVSKKKTVRR